MKLTENYKNRVKTLAGLKILSEDMHPQFYDCGFYDMANGNHEVLIEKLQEANLTYSYDEGRNYIVIETNNPRQVLPLFEEAGIKKVGWKESLENNMDKDPNDCVLLRLPAPNVPPGAMM